MDNITKITEVFNAEDLWNFIDKKKEKLQEVADYLKSITRENAALLESREKWKNTAIKRKEQVVEFSEKNAILTSNNNRLIEFIKDKVDEKEHQKFFKTLEKDKKSSVVKEIVSYDNKDKPRVLLQVETNISSSESAVEYIRHTEGLNSKGFIDEFPFLQEYLPKYETSNELIDRCLSNGIPLIEVFPGAIREIIDLNNASGKKITDKDIIDSLRSLNDKVFISDRARGILSMDHSHNIKFNRAFKNNHSWVIEILVEVRKKIL